MSDLIFDVSGVLRHLKHYLPAQAPLKDFIHHNPLHAYQHLKFYDAIFKASEIFGYQVTLQLKEYRQLYKSERISEKVLERVIIESKGYEDMQSWKRDLLHRNFDTSNTPRIGLLRAKWKNYYKIDLDSKVYPLLFRVLCSYIDQGIADWKFPNSGNNESNSFLGQLRELEGNSYTSLFRKKRAKDLLLNRSLSINSLLDILVGDEAYYEQYLFDQQFSHPGWSGMAASIETNPDSLLYKRNMSLHDLIIFELLLEIDALDDNFSTWQPLCTAIINEPVDILADYPLNELNDVFSIWQDAFEWSYYDTVIAALEKNNVPKQEIKHVVPEFQAVFCIDERECSLRRHIETLSNRYETYGTPGFFGVEFYFQPFGASFYDKLCPAPVTPKYLIKEFDGKKKRHHEPLNSKLTNNLFGGFLSSFTLGYWSLIKLVSDLLRPRMNLSVSNSFMIMDAGSKLSVENKDAKDRENGLQIGFTVDEMAVRVEELFKSIGLTEHFAPVIYLIGHGSSSANNPHHVAHDCGACSGRPGSVNAKVMAHMSNHSSVREQLAKNGLIIPEGTQFVGGLHDTASDLVEFYDTDILSGQNKERHEHNKVKFENALDLNAKERSRRFASIDTSESLQNIRSAIQKRSVSLYEPRPELGHGTNTVCIVGRRAITKGLFLDRRTFLNSYDPGSDPEGKLLSKIMKPLGPVCGGINLEYYFSRVDNQKFGAGTKLPHNVMGLVGVANSSDGDLRTGLPVQMIEVHDPMRLLIVVEHYPEIVLKTIQADPGVYEWFANNWMHLIAAEPGTNKYYIFKDDRFVAYNTIESSIEQVTDIQKVLEEHPGMKTNEIADATKENLPVFILN